MSLRPFITTIMSVLFSLQFQLDFYQCSSGNNKNIKICNPSNQKFISRFLIERWIDAKKELGKIIFYYNLSCIIEKVYLTIIMQEVKIVMTL